MRRRIPRTRVSVPSVPPTFVPRPRLAELLATLTRAPVTLVCAPAGFGKTQVLADWIRRSGRLSGSAAWMTPGADDDRSRFWSTLADALDDGGPPPFPAWTPGTTADELDLVVELADRFGPGRAPLLLVVDGVDVPQRDGPLGALGLLLRHLPENLHLVLVARTVPELPLARLRLEGRLAEMPADRLRLDDATAVEILRRASGPDGTEAQRRSAVKRAGGWPAALRIRRDPSSADDGSPDPVEGFLLEDLAGEALAGLPVGDLEIVRAVCIADEVPVDLVAALAERPDAAAALTRIDRDRGLVAAADAGATVYRLSEPIREHLRSELQREHPTELRRMHRRAAEWFDRHGRPRDAVDQATRGGDPELGALLDRHGVDLLMGGHHELVRSATEMLGPLTGARNALLEAAVATRAGRPGLAEVALEHARWLWPSDPDPDLAVLGVLVAGEVDGSESFGRGSPEPAPDTALAGWAAVRRAEGLLPDHPDRARAELERAGRIADDRDLPDLGLRVRWGRVMVAVTRSDHAATLAGADAVLAHAERNGIVGHPLVAPARIVRAVADLLRLRPDAVLDGLTGMTLHTGLMALDPLVAALVALAQFDLGREDADVPARLLAARGSLADQPMLAAVVGALAVWEFDVATVLRQPARAREVARWVDERLGPDTAESALLAARTHLRAGRPEVARHTVAVILDGGHPVLLPATPVEARLVDAVASLRLGGIARARRSVREALVAAAPLRLLRPFRSVPPDVLEMVRSARSRGPGDDVAAEVVDRIGALAGAADHPGLTEKERTVLALLGSQRSVDEIARDLTVSTNTVKTHLRGIYVKLGVRSRREAVDAADERGLLRRPD